jgi:hypothetical protein
MEAMAAVAPEAVAVTAETTPAPETAEKPAEPKKPARKKVAQKQQPQNFFDFFTGGRSWDNRSYDNRNRSARANDRNGFRPFF